MNGPTDRFATSVERVAHRWVARYTAGLDEQSRSTRLDEVASDLHEHRTAFAARGISSRRTGLSMLARMVRGVPADLLWRWQSLAAPHGFTRRRTSMSAHEPTGTKAWRPLPEPHRFNQLNDVVDVTSDRVGPDAGEGDRVVARNAANIAAGISAGGIQ